MKKGRLTRALILGLAEGEGSFATKHLSLRKLYFYLCFPHCCFHQAHQVCFANLRTLCI